ncbi:hypothetical protein AJ78_03189 [Emergomyces pasteurianus Ep9510]|uniref:Mediator of RNA polymerase II transcription subunit 9 n=1 Tax=Emergomyces pasteurianus Ep9510 TaxID=1447872 RepID=A0A1J9QKH0_9EURO|nr:hypothetical protein AJ78_03189 [Emergomyces pasteurianus Ep9510]
MASSHTPPSASIPALKISSFQPATSNSSPATPSHHLQQHQSQPHSQTQRQPQQQQQQEKEDVPPPFPPPQTFDILPPLHDLLLRLASTPSNLHQHAADPTSAGGNAASAAAGSGPGPGGSHANTTATRSTAIDTAAVAFLDPKLLLSEASAVKIRVQKAKAALEALPDMERTVAEQEEEIVGLEERIERLGGVIVEFGRRSKGFAGDPGMG